MNRHPSDQMLLLALDGEIETEEQAEVMAHVDACSVCRAKWRNLETLSQDVMQYHALRLQAGVAPPAFAPPVPAVLGRSGARAGMFAAIAALAAFLLWRAPESYVATPLPPAKDRGEVRLETPQTTMQRAVVNLPPRRSRPRPAEEQNPEEQPFHLLPYSDRSLPLDGAVMLLLDLPREDLPDAEFPAVESTGERVLAEVLMGVDGLPRAFRLVP